MALGYYHFKKLNNKTQDESGPRRLLNAAAYTIHSAIHIARPDVLCAAHTHSIHGKAFSTLGVELDMLTQDTCAFYTVSIQYRDRSMNCSLNFSNRTTLSIVILVASSWTKRKVNKLQRSLDLKRLVSYYHPPTPPRFLIWNFRLSSCKIMAFLWQLILSRRHSSSS